MTPPALVLLAAAAAGSPAAAQQEARDAVRCLVVSSVLVSLKDPAIRTAGLAATMYWLGRANALMDDAALDRRMMEEASRMTGTDLKLEGQRCGAEMEARGKALEATGRKLEALEARRRLD